MKRYEEIYIEVLLLDGEDVITTSLTGPNDNGFDSKGDSDWTW